ncbi:hypothetical protein DPMN_068511 [Dreissena polymorpha]|uniref:Uncharacterized protein n=1 Tax=Dreissena polymorpha TaxID=45954 RepID=A0A9D4BM96_DREPO|nr:hypothetical protein DPMN_068511 [Dreissena polymorpha]
MIERESERWLIVWGSCVIDKRSRRIELGRVWSGNFGDRDDRVDRIGKVNSVFEQAVQQSV